MTKYWNKRRKKSLRTSLVYIGLIITLSFLAYVYREINVYLQEGLASFRLQDIEINGNHLLSRSDVLQLCGFKKGQTKLMEISPSQIAIRLKESPYVFSAGAVRSLPATLRITIKERRPIAFIYGHGLNLIDDQGVLLPVPRKNIRWSLPFITGVQTATLGTLGEKTPSAKALKAIEILEYLQFIKSPLYQVIAEINVKDPSDIHLRLIKGGAEVRLETAHYQDNLFVLSEYFDHYLNWNRLAAIRYFDVRFKDQLIIKGKKG